MKWSRATRVVPADGPGPTGDGLPTLPVILETWPEPFLLTDRDGRILRANEAAAALTGMGLDDLTGRMFLDLVHVDDRTPLRADLLTLAAGSKGDVRDFRIVAAEGEARWVEGIGANLLTASGVEALVLLTRDCTERKQAESAAQRAAVNGREAYRRYRVAFETTLVGMATADIDGFYIDVNAALCAFLGTSRDQLVGRHLTAAVHRDDAPLLEQSWAGMVGGRVAGSRQHEIRYQRADGTVVVGETALVPIGDDRGSPLSLMVFTQDVTDRHAALAASQSALDREQQATQQLRELEETKSKLLAAVSHDFRTPLTAIAGFAQLLVEQWDAFDEEKRRDFAARITRNAAELDGRVTEFLELARRDHSPDGVELVACRLHEVVQHAVQRCRFVLEQHVVELTLTPVDLMTEAAAVGRILDNLLTNAAKYSPAGTTVQVVLEAGEGGVATVSVLDEGPGIPESEKERIFEPFFRRAETESSAPGTGVGLGGARALAERLGGTLTVRDNIPTGSAFSLTLPMG